MVCVLKLKVFVFLMMMVITRFCGAGTRKGGVPLGADYESGSSQVMAIFFFFSFGCSLFYIYCMS